MISVHVVYVFCPCPCLYQCHCQFQCHSWSHSHSVHVHVRLLTFIHWNKHGKIHTLTSTRTWRQTRHREVAAAGSWIGTGAGAGGKLNKYGEADRAAEGKLGVGEAAAVQGNCSWLISGATVTLNFLKKSTPSMGPAIAACKNWM
jgi:hypothetical protein